LIRFRTASTRFARARADAAALLVPAPRSKRAAVVEGSSRLHRSLDEVCRADRFRAKKGETLLYHALAGAAARRYLVVGLGEAKEVGLEALRHGASAAARRAISLGARSLALALPEDGPGGDTDPGRVAQALVEGVLLGTYRFDRYRKDKDAEERSRLRTVDLLIRAPGRALRDGVRRGETYAGAANFARALVDEPAAVITPARMAAIAREEARRVGLTCRVLGLAELRRRGMGGLIGVGRGSAEEPCLIHVTYRPSGRPRRKVALVGKGITFDSGGLSLKTATGMETMKADMAGAAAVLAVLRALPALAPPVQVDGYLAMAENLPSGTAQKPGDVLRTLSGKTVEVVNTDAEGRLVLADALTYAAEARPDQILDLATLTGACVVALGPLASGVMGTDESLVQAIVSATRFSGEKMWPLPLYPDYREMLDSPVADMKNSAQRWAGAITAGLFLKEFVKPGIPWVHLDIAGPAFLESDHAYLRKGGTGAGVRTVLQHLESLA
jgi:leucyl aminopeptidase